MTKTIAPMAASRDHRQLASTLVEQAQAEGVELVGPGGLLTGLTKTVLETALEAELSDHLGYDKHDPGGATGQLLQRHSAQDGADRGGPGGDRGPAGPGRHVGAGDPAQAGASPGECRLDGIDQMVLSLTARSLTTGRSARPSR
jgi:putative transposase